MKIVVFGTGYVGLVTGTCLSDVGHEVICVDVNAARIEALNRGEVPIYEPGLAELIARNTADGRLTFTLEPQAALDGAEIVFIAVGTPSSEEGSADLSYEAAHDLEVAREALGWAA